MSIQHIEVLRRVVALGRSGQTDAALAVCKALLRNAPTFADGWIIGSMLHQEAGDLPTARDWMRQALTLRPQDATAQQGLANILLVLGDAAGAIPHLAAAWRLQPDKPSAAVALASTLAGLGRADEAIRAYTAALDADPACVEAWIGMGLVLLHSDRISEAAGCLQRATALAPARLQAWVGLGAARGQLGDPAASAAAFQRATEIDPTFGRAWHGLGMARSQLGERAAAAAALARAAELSPERARYHFNLGNALNQCERHAEAAEALRRAIALNDRLPAAHNNLGSTYMLLGEVARAAGCFQAAIAIDPDMARAHANLANAMTILGSVSRPIRRMMEALNRAPGDVYTLHSMGHLLVAEGHLDPAERSFKLVLRVEPDHVGAIGGLAAVAERRQDYQQAYALLQPLIAADRLRTTNVLRVFATACNRLGRPAEAIAAVEAALGQHSRPMARSFLLYALGDARDAQGDHDRAFRAYEQANTLRSLSFSTEEHDALVTEITSGYTRERLSARTGWEEPDARPVFIVGMPRSGTTLTEQILAAHPAIHGGGELEHLRLLEALLRKKLENVGGGSLPALLDGLTVPGARQLGRWYLERLERRTEPGALRITDKLPFNLFHLGLAAHVLPGARVIVCRRDPVDTCWSCFTKNFNQSLAFTTRLEWLGRVHRNVDRVIAHWREHLTLPMLEVRYETLVAEPEAQARRLIDFVGLDWDPACLRFYDSGRSVRTASYDQVRRPIYTSSIGRAIPYRAHLGPLEAALAG